MEEKSYLSKEKYEELRRELAELKTSRRREVAERLEAAKSLGDLAENAEYHAARDDQSDLESRIIEIENTLKLAQIVSEHHGGSIGVGSTVVVKKSGQAADQTFTIVGSEEANIAKSRISHQSPLGIALLGRKKNEQVTVKTPKGDMVYKIINVL